MAHPRFPRPYAVCVILALTIVLCLAIVNMGAAAYLASSYPDKQDLGIAIAVICGAATFVDTHPIAALLDSTRKVPRPATVVTAFFDFLLIIGLVFTGVLLLMSDYYYQRGSDEPDGPPWQATMGLVILLTLVHMGRRVILLFWACIYGCAASSSKRKAARRAEAGSGQQIETVALETGPRGNAEQPQRDAP